MKIAQSLEPTETNEDLGSSVGSENESDSSVESSPSIIKLSPKVISESGLDMYQVGDIMYAPVKLKVTGDASGKIDGISIEAMGSASDSIPDNNSMIDLTDGSTVEDEGDTQTNDATKGEPNPDAMGESGGENTTGENSGESAERYSHDTGDVDAETKMLGYKRPRTAKNKKISVKDLFGEK